MEALCCRCCSWWPRFKKGASADRSNSFLQFLQISNQVRTQRKLSPDQTRQELFYCGYFGQGNFPHVIPAFKGSFCTLSSFCCHFAMALQTDGAFSDFDPSECSSIISSLTLELLLLILVVQVDINYFVLVFTL